MSDFLETVGAVVMATVVMLFGAMMLVGYFLFVFAIVLLSAWPFWVSVAAIVLIFKLL